MQKRRVIPRMTLLSILLTHISFLKSCCYRLLNAVCLLRFPAHFLCFGSQRQPGPPDIWLSCILEMITHICSHWNKAYNNAEHEIWLGFNVILNGTTTKIAFFFVFRSAKLCLESYGTSFDPISDQNHFSARN